MIFDIRGTNGSGKSTIVRSFVQQFDCEKDEDGYIVKPFDMRIVGHYPPTSGGCDNIKPRGEIYDRIERGIEEHEHVMFEGAANALIVQPFIDIKFKYHFDIDEGYKFFFMDTPLEICIDQYNQRMKSKGLPSRKISDLTKNFYKCQQIEKQLKELGHNPLKLSRLNGFEHIKGILEDELKVLRSELSEV